MEFCDTISTREPRQLFDKIYHGICKFNASVNIDYNESTYSNDSSLRSQ